MSKKSDRQQSISALIAKLAYETLAWAIENGCKRDSKTGEIGNYFIIEEGKRPTGKPVWTEAFNQDAETWIYVKQAMIRRGFPIAYDNGNGHYLGSAGESGKMVGTRFNSTATSLKNIREMAIAIIESEMWSEAKAYIENALKHEYRDKDILSLIENIERFMEFASGLPTQQSIAVYLLKMGGDNDADADTEDEDDNDAESEDSNE